MSTPFARALAAVRHLTGPFTRRGRNEAIRARLKNLPEGWYDGPDGLTQPAEPPEIPAPRRGSAAEPVGRNQVPLARDQVPLARDPAPVARDQVPLARDPAPVVRDPASDGSSGPGR